MSEVNLALRVAVNLRRIMHDSGHSVPSLARLLWHSTKQASREMRLGHYLNGATWFKDHGDISSLCAALDVDPVELFKPLEPGARLADYKPIRRLGSAQKRALLRAHDNGGLEAGTRTPWRVIEALESHALLVGNAGVYTTTDKGEWLIAARLRPEPTD